MSILGDCITLRGDEHNDCQDSSAIAFGEEYAIAAISDGHGGIPHIRSGKGSKLAVMITLDQFKVQLTDKSFINKFVFSNKNEKQNYVEKLIQNVLFKWWSDCIKDYMENELNQNEKKILNSNHAEFILDNPTKLTDNDQNRIVSLYGTTLLIVVMHEKFSFGIQIGDGAIISINKDHTINFDCINDDAGCNDNYTTSLCQRKNSFRTFVHEEEMPIAYALYSDGLQKSYTQIDISKIVKGSLCLSQIPNMWYGSVVKQFESCTHSKIRSGDDTSYAYLMREDIDLDEMYEKTFNLSSPGISRRNKPILKSKICFDGFLNGDQFNERVRWKSKSNYTYYGNLINGVPSPEVAVGTSRYKCNIIDFELSGEGCEYQNNQLIYKGSFKNGRRFGIGTEYDSKGNKKFEGFFKNGRRFGIGTEYDSKGNKKFEGSFINGLRSGDGKEYFNGKIIYNGKFVHG